MNKVSKFVSENPLKSVLAAVFVTALAQDLVERNPLAPEPLAQYRIVFGTGYEYRKCGDHSKASFSYYSQIKEDGLFFDSWKSSGWCDESYEKAKSKVEEILTNKLEARQREEEVYQAYIGKKDKVFFEPLEVVIK